jgi:hypothetical protein
MHEHLREARELLFGRRMKSGRHRAPIAALAHRARKRLAPPLSFVLRVQSYSRARINGRSTITREPIDEVKHLS